jgi:hypothetical protein
MKLCITCLKTMLTGNRARVASLDRRTLLNLPKTSPLPAVDQMKRLDHALGVLKQPLWHSYLFVACIGDPAHLLAMVTLVLVCFTWASHASQCRSQQLKVSFLFQLRNQCVCLQCTSRLPFATSTPQHACMHAWCVHVTDASNTLGAVSRGAQLRGPHYECTKTKHSPVD